MPAVPDNGPYPWERKNRVYLAARYSRNEEMRGVADVLAALGYEVTSRWIQAPQGRYGRGSFTREQLADDPEYCARVAQRDIEDIAGSDILIAFTEAEPGGKGGRHVELGFALCMQRMQGRRGMRIIAVGPREHVFHATEGVEWYPDWPRLVMALTRESRQAAGPVTEEAEIL